MSLFTSSRERRLWLWTLATLVAIYSTLGVARVAVEFLRERNLLRVTVAVLLLMVAVTIAVGLVRRRPGRREVAVALGFAFVSGLALVRMDRPEERTHLMEYGLVAGLIYVALEERRENGGRVPGGSWLLAVLGTAVLGWLDEGIQALLPSRVYDLRDVAFNAFAGLLAPSALVLLERARERDASTG